MGYHSTRKRSQHGRLSAADVVAILLVIAAVVGLVLWIIAKAGGGHFVY